MNTNICISKNEIQILSTMVGKTLSCYKTDPFIYSPTTFGIVGLYIDNQPFKLLCSLENVQRFNATEDAAKFSIVPAQEDEIVSYMEGGQLTPTLVEQKIKSVTVVNDHQVLKNEEMEASFDSTIGIIFTCDDDLEISFSLTSWFSEMIAIRKGYNLAESMIPLSEFNEEWEGCGFEVSSVRSTTVLG